MYQNNEIDYLKFLKDKKIYIFGAGIRGQRCCFRLQKAGYDVKAFIDNNNKLWNQKKLGIDILSLDQFVEEKDCFIIISLANAKAERDVKMQLLERDIYRYASESLIDWPGGEDYYDESYFLYQKKLGEFGATWKKRMFQSHILQETILVEFGSGGGYLLRELDAKEKIGIEINDTARQNAREIGIKSVKNISDIPDDYADVIISTSVLEHVEDPLGTIRELRKKLKDGGKVVFHVPNEGGVVDYKRSDVDNHFFSWNCLQIGNLFKAAGYFVHSVQGIYSAWPEHFEEIANEINDEHFDALTKINGIASNTQSCLIVAYK